MVLTFDTHGNEKQKECVRHWVDNSVNDILYGGSKGSAKSFTGCSLIFGDALMYAGIHLFIARKKLNDLRKFTTPSIYEVFNCWGLDPGLYLKWNGMDSFFLLPNKSKVFLLDAKYLPSDPLYERFGSMQMTRGWIEEAGEFEEAAKNNLHASVGRWKNDEYGINGKILQTCNPSKNYLYRKYYIPFKKNVLSKDIRFVQALPTDNKMLNSGYVENLHKILTPNEKERLLYGNWEYDDDPEKLMNYDSISSIFSNTFVAEGAKCLTCDVARLGKDTTVIMYWNGLRIEYIFRMEKSRTNEIADKINELRNRFGVSMYNVVIDEDGVGGGVVDLLRGCKGFIANSKPIGKKANYANLKSQVNHKMAEDVNDNKVYCYESEFTDTIVEELEQVKGNLQDDGKRRVNKREDILKMIGRSPDFLSAMYMRWLLLLRKETKYVKI